MGSPFQFTGPDDVSRADEISPRVIKIDEAKRQVLKLIREDAKRSISRVTIIPFDDNVLEPILTWSCEENIRLVEEYLDRLHPGGGTNLFSALERAFSLEEDAGVTHYQIITDGESGTADQDIEFVGNLLDSKRSRIFGILIDLPGDGEAHLLKLLLAPYYLKRVTGQKDFQKEMEYARQRSELVGAIDQTLSHQANLSTRFDKVAIPSPSIESIKIKIGKRVEDLNDIVQKALQSQVDYDTLHNYIVLAKNTYEVQSNLLIALETFTECIKTMNVKIALPRLLSKRFSSIMLIQIYPPDKIEDALNDLNEQLHGINQKLIDYGISEFESDINIGMTVKINAECPNIEFSDSVVKEVKDKVNSASILATPKDTCSVGKQWGKISIVDNESNVELFSVPVELNIVDFVFDHISRPFVLKLIAAFSGLGAFIMFVLTFLGQVDTTLGLTSGTTAVAVAVTLYFRFASLFQRLHPANSVP